MNRQLALLTVVAAMLVVSTASAQIVQEPDTDYLVFEAEDFSVDDRNGEFTGWLIIDPAAPSEVILHDSNPGEIMVPPPNANMSGKAIFDQVGGGDFADQVGWELNFATPGEYFLYARYSMYDLRNLFDNGYGNEDSIYLPPFDMNDDPAGDSPEVRDDRAGNSSLRRVVNADFPEGQGIEPTPLDGCRIPDEPWVIPEDECEGDELRAEVSFEGQYYWEKVRFSSRDDLHTSYIVEDTGTVLDFAIATRERGSSLDAFVFSQNDELGLDDLDALLFAPEDPLAPLDIPTITDPQERADYVHDVLGTWVGDSNLDGEFNSGDFVKIFTDGQYQDGIEGNSSWVTGDWTGDKEFDSGDFVAAFTDGGYNAGVRPAIANAVPEPSAMLLVALALVGLSAFRRDLDG